MSDIHKGQNKFEFMHGYNIVFQGLEKKYQQRLSQNKETNTAQQKHEQRIFNEIKQNNEKHSRGIKSDHTWSGLMPQASRIVFSKQSLAICIFSSVIQPARLITSILSKRGFGIVSVTLAVQTNRTYAYKKFVSVNIQVKQCKSRKSVKNKIVHHTTSYSEKPSKNIRRKE